MRPSRVALVTGGSRGIGAATARSLAERGYDVLITYRNKAARADAVKTEIIALGRRCRAVACDVTRARDVEHLFSVVESWAARLDVLVLNASGGLERDLIKADPSYPRQLNRDAQISLVEHALPVMTDGGTIVFVTSHWAHLYGRVTQLPNYSVVAESKWAGEHELRSRQTQLAERGIRLLVVTGDLVEGTITPKLLERAAPGLAARRRDVIGALPTTEDMGEAIASAVADTSLPWGHTIVVGGSLQSLEVNRAP